jgi:hypothetical protein
MTCHLSHDDRVDNDGGDCDRVDSDGGDGDGDRADCAHQGANPDSSEVEDSSELEDSSDEEDSKSENGDQAQIDYTTCKTVLSVEDFFGSKHHAPRTIGFMVE